MNVRPRVLAYAAMVLIAAAFAVAARYRGPAPPGDDAPPTRFSAARARRVLERLLADGRPHPVGSPANAAVRDRLIAELSSAGYDAQSQAFRECPSNCVDGTNVVAELRGHDAQHAVVLSAHYDSASGGPGAADDGSGVAIALDVARMLKLEATPARSVIFLFDDGEESGLLGAEAFLRDHPAARRASTVVNLEARGTSGPSLMFETSGSSARLVPLFARAVERPIASSLFAGVYRRMPNDTDLSAFRRHAIDGFDFAFIGDAQNYHSATDDLARLSDESLQHQGDNALALVRALAATGDAERGATGDAVYFDVFARWVVHWRSERSPQLLGLCALVLAGAVGIRRLLRVDRKNLGRALLVWPTAMTSALVLGLGLEHALGERTSLATIWPIRFELPLAASVAASVTAGLFALAVAGPCTALAFHVSTAAGLALAALCAMFVVPGAEYVALIPCFASALAAVALAALAGWSTRRRDSVATVLAEAITALALVPQAVVLLPIYRLLYPALGLYSATLLVVAFAPGTVVLGPALSSVAVRGRWLAAACTALVGVALAVWATRR